MSEKKDATEDCGSSDCSPARECDLNPVHQGLYEWGDTRNTMVEINRDGSATIIQGDQVVKLDCFGFFRDVTDVFEKAIAAMPESELEMTLSYRSIGTTRSLPTCEWD